jgi:hypothetical protein
MTDDDDKTPMVVPTTTKPTTPSMTTTKAGTSTSTIIVSPYIVPLNHEEESCAEVCALAKALAPSIVEADEIIQVPIEFRYETTNIRTTTNNTTTSNNDDDNDDDYLDDEIDALQSSEAILRQELELAQDFSSLFQFTIMTNNNEDDDEDEDNDKPNTSMDHGNMSATITIRNENDDDHEINFSPMEGTPEQQSSTGNNPIVNAATGTNSDVDVVINAEDQDDSIIIDNDETRSPIKLPSSIHNSNRSNTITLKQPNDVVDDEPFLFITSGTCNSNSSPLSSLSLRRTKRSNTDIITTYTINDHQRNILLQKEKYGGWYTIGIVQDFGYTISNNHDNEHDDTFDNNRDNLLLHNAVKEYCVSIPDSTLQQLFVGIPPPNASSEDENNKNCNNNANKTKSTPTKSSIDANGSSTTTTLSSSLLPVRTITMQIRPDVLCGAVMEVVHYVLLQQLHVQITKRQGGHIQGIVMTTSTVPTTTTQTDNNNIENNTPFMIDVRLVTSKSETCDRVLLIRIYHTTHDHDIVSDTDNHSPDGINTMTNTENVTIDTEELDPTSSYNDTTLLYENNPIENVALHLREAAALIQIIESSSSSLSSTGKKLNHKKRIIHTPTSINTLSQSEIQFIVSKHLLDNYRACPSVQDHNITLPSLNSEDYKIIHSSTHLIQLIWDELETRDLAYITLRSSRCGSFPSLPTLDVQYCSQIRRISRDIMTKQLIKSASELEQYAREEELSCANMITLLKPTFDLYGIEAPQLPKPKQLTEYTFDFVAAQVACPPWGDKVQHALNEIQVWTGIANQNDNNNYSPGTLDVQLLHPSSPSLQYTEQSIELANEAVRLVLEAFQKQDDDEQSARLGRKNIQVMDRLSKMQEYELLSIQTLQNCYNISNIALLASQNFHTKCGIREVPLLKWTIMVGRSTGTCTISANHILFITKLIPVLGGNRTTVFNIHDIELILEEQTATILNPLPTIIHVKQNRRTIYSFRPSVGAVRLKNFFDVVKAVGSRTILPPVF